MSLLVLKIHILWTGERNEQQHEVRDIKYLLESFTEKFSVKPRRNLKNNSDVLKFGHIFLIIYILFFCFFLSSEKILNIYITPTYNTSGSDTGNFRGD